MFKNEMYQVKEIYMCVCVCVYNIITNIDNMIMLLRGQQLYRDTARLIDSISSDDRKPKKITRAKRKSQARRVAMQCMRY